MQLVDGAHHAKDAMGLSQRLVLYVINQTIGRTFLRIWVSMIPSRVDETIGRVALKGKHTSEHVLKRWDARGWLYRVGVRRHRWR